MSIIELGAVELAAKIRSKDVSAVEVVDAVLEQIDAQSRLNAFVTVSAERARSEAKAADAAVARGDAVGPLHGVPFSVKDLTDTERVRTTYGTRLMQDHVPAADAVAVARARGAGAILIGKTTTPEYGHKAFTEGPLFGRTLNPWRDDVTCGGSSGGAGVAVAAGMGPLALGTDGGGSIRIPAACNGIVGFKATLGVIPHLQVPDAFGANSYVGPMARTVADTRLLFDAVAGPDRRDPYGQGLATLPPSRVGRRIGWLPTCGNALDPEVEQISQVAVSKATDLGFEIETIDIDFVTLEKAFLVILRSALAARLGAQADARPEMFDLTLLKTIEAGRRYTATDLVAAQAARTDCFRKVQNLFERVDLIASPTLSAPPLPVTTDPLGPVVIAGRSFEGVRGGWYPYTYPFNLTGHPALSLPCGLTSGGLPLGLQFVGRWNEDVALLDRAERFEAAIGFTSRPPLAKETAVG